MNTEDSSSVTASPDDPSSVTASPDDSPTVTVSPEQVVVRAAPGQTIMSALSTAGFGYRVGCRRGGCGVCKMDVLSGRVEYRTPIAATVLDDTEIAAGTCLSCRAVPIGDVVVRLRNHRLRRLHHLFGP
ncbi:2Fe-2S iron-sulfur cluster-binding protein [Streptomyces sp. NPDC000609]|uniref:2Fe-2S iron-sulfur cluster-binding protein n=1 Tax=Streptomyces sp. NPDC000609 TaxID=3160957 RepID=UPI0033951234